MTYRFKAVGRLLSGVLLGLTLMPWGATRAEHDIPGITGPTFNLYAAPFNISLPEGSSLYMWGFGDMTGQAGTSLPQYPGPTLIVTEGQDVTINLTNYGVPSTLPTADGPADNPVSIVVAGHHVAATGGTTGLVTNGAKYGETVSYTFTAGKPGTYVYHSLDGPNPGLHVEMGLLGALIVRPADGSRTAYGAGTETDYDQEYLYLLTEADPDVHFQMERGHYGHFTNADRFATVYFANGRVYPDLVQGDYNPLFPHQPYQSLAMSHPRDKVLVRNLNAGHDSHPFHYHGENHRFVGRDGNMLSSDGQVADLGRSDNTINSAPKQSVDAIWTWTGKDLGWDIYGTTNGHTCTDAGDGFDADTREYCADHGKAIPVDLPGVAELTLGGFWSGSPYMGDVGDLPPGEGGLNPNGGYFFVWHSHAEKELTTFDIFPGGSLSAMVVLPTSVDIQ
ncbi:multicopper oxidase domain-containing protein [Thiorhodococcus mannitoliphagus]|uniref:Multicopper oxidase domain-containing protein n=1 Tax=Thiorhodococcus mannitoliphagus TaxID=329406 RepID=A0A6P1DP23_9GAMM|nr:multicopper oxidase domain-containing protein [Thiorhodococcus mannitoliphagus]NEX18953.1 multicopper oxidase domain-containing protein [Thiorhodococcus mannitoliphagus]